MVEGVVRYGYGAGREALVLIDCSTGCETVGRHNGDLFRMVVMSFYYETGTPVLVSFLHLSCWTLIHEDSRNHTFPLSFLHHRKYLSRAAKADCAKVAQSIDQQKNTTTKLFLGEIPAGAVIIDDNKQWKMLMVSLIKVSSLQGFRRACILPPGLLGKPRTVCFRNEIMRLAQWRSCFSPQM